MNALFIDETYLKQNSPFSQNISVEDIYPFAKKAEDIYIQEAVGTSMYNYLKGVMLASPYNPSANDILVLDLVRSALVWYILHDALPFVWVKVRNIGLVKQSGDNMEAVSEGEMNRLQAECKTSGVFYMNRLISFLCENGSDYSAYNTGCWSCGDIAPASRKYNSIPLYFDK